MRGWWWKLAIYAIPQWRGLLFIALTTLALIGVKLVAPWPLKLIVDHAVVEKPLPDQLRWIGALPGGGTSKGLLAWLAAATVAFFLSKRVLTIALNYVKEGTATGMVNRLASDLFQRLLHRSIVFHGKQRVGDLVRRVTSDCSCVKELVMNVYLPVVTSLITLVSMFAIMWQLNRGLALFALALAVPLGLVTKLFCGPMTDRVYREQQLQGRLMAFAEQTLTAVPLVQAFARQETEDTRFRGLARETVRASLRTLWSQQQFNVSTNTVTKLATATVMVVGGLSVLRGSMSLGSLLVLISYFGTLYSPIENLAYLGIAFAGARAGARRVFEIAEMGGAALREAAHARDIPLRPDQTRGYIQLENVTFGYEPERPVLHAISLEARPGETVALVGHTGAGKSTLVSLILRLHDPWSGRICFDGTDVRDVRLESLRDAIGIVMQEPFLFRMSVAENIAYGRPEASRDEIVAAARAARAHEFVESLPYGYDTIVGERGTTLSGGEKQRLSIARALLKNAPVLILDEPTSALDSQTESALVEALERLTTGRTTFLIAHRLSTIRKADRVVVLEQGRVVESGFPEELLPLGGKYADLQQSQLVRF